MKQGWEVKRLGEVSTIINGGTPKSQIPEFWNGEVLWITPKDMGKLKGRTVAETPRKITELGLKKSSAKLIKANSVILSTRAPIGHLVINLKEMATNQGCRGIEPSNELFTEYLFYFLSGQKEELNALGVCRTFFSRMLKSRCRVNSVEGGINAIEIHYS